MYIYVCMYVYRESDGISLAQKKKNMSNIPLFKKKRDPNRTAADEDGDNESEYAESEDEQEVLHTYIHTYIHTLHTYIHTYIHALT